MLGGDEIMKDNAGVTIRKLKRAMTPHRDSDKTGLQSEFQPDGCDPSINCNSDPALYVYDGTQI